MRVRLRHLWETLISGYWFVPGLMVFGATIVAWLMLTIDRAVIATDRSFVWLYAGGSDGAKTLLSTVAGSFITVAGVVFSITISALTQASSQFGPRLLRNFMRDRGNQIVLGTFLATFLYCLLILRTIHGEVGDGKPFVPHASVTFAVVLAVASIAVLIYFVHHVSVSLQAPSVVAAVRSDLEDAINELPSDQRGAAVAIDGTSEDDELRRLPPGFDAAARAVPSPSDGYLQAVDYEAIVSLAAKHDLMLRLACRPGDYLFAGAPLLWAWPVGRCDDATADKLPSAFIIGRQDTAEQDLEQGFRQMVEVAVRALSPGINDPFTAVNCLDALGSAICRVASRGLPGSLRHDDEGVLRLLVPVPTFEGVCDTAFNQIRQYGRDSVAVTLRLLEVIAICISRSSCKAQRQALWRHAEMTHRQGIDAFFEERDRKDVRERWATVLRELEKASQTTPQGRRKVAHLSPP